MIFASRRGPGGDAHLSAARDRRAIPAAVGPASDDRVGLARGRVGRANVRGAGAARAEFVGLAVRRSDALHADSLSEIAKLTHAGALRVRRALGAAGIGHALAGGGAVVGADALDAALAGGLADLALRAVERVGALDIRFARVVDAVVVGGAILGRHAENALASRRVADRVIGIGLAVEAVRTSSGRHDALGGLADRAHRAVGVAGALHAGLVGSADLIHRAILAADAGRDRHHHTTVIGGGDHAAFAVDDPPPESLPLHPQDKPKIPATASNANRRITRPSARMNKLSLR